MGQNQLQRSHLDAQLKALETQVTAESNAMRQAIASASELLHFDCLHSLRTLCN
ncbi:MAG: hypothetical protein V7K21_15315 [Nostoc sp.]|uniref:hypothetical protein n=1 Tax=Nostoc sp. TaxID=1180 RepID=UPI002FF638F9